MADVSISIRDNGPILVKGGAMVTDAEGKTWESKDVIALCLVPGVGRKTAARLLVELKSTGFFNQKNT